MRPHNLVFMMFIALCSQGNIASAIPTEPQHFKGQRELIAGRAVGQIINAPVSMSIEARGEYDKNGLVKRVPETKTLLAGMGLLICYFVSKHALEGIAKNLNQVINQIYMSQPNGVEKLSREEVQEIVKQAFSDNMFCHADFQKDLKEKFPGYADFKKED